MNSNEWGLVAMAVYFLVVAFWKYVLFAVGMVTLVCVAIKWWWSR